MGQISELVVRCSGPSLWLAQKMLADVKPDIFANKPAPGGKIIDTNHPAFVYGHLSLYPAKILQWLGIDSAAAAVPPAYAELFEGGKPCHDDPDRRIYPPMDEITGHFFRSYNALLEAIRNLPDEKFSVPNPHPRLKEMFPEMSGLVVFMVTSHIMLHMGQVSAWRRFNGLGSVM